MVTTHLLNHHVSKWSSCSSNIRLHSKLLLSHRPSRISMRRISLWGKQGTNTSGDKRMKISAWHDIKGVTGKDVFHKVGSDCMNTSCVSYDMSKYLMTFALWKCNCDKSRSGTKQLNYATSLITLTSSLQHRNLQLRLKANTTLMLDLMFNMLSDVMGDVRAGWPVFAQTGCSVLPGLIFGQLPLLPGCVSSSKVLLCCPVKPLKSRQKKWSWKELVGPR